MIPLPLNDWIEKKINDKDINCFEYSEFTILEGIGEGRFGTVYKAEWNQRGMKVAALKCLKNNSQTDEKKIKEFIRELKSIRNFYYHGNINRFYGITKDELGNYLMVLQYANQGNLRNYLENKEIFNSLQWEHKIQMALDITTGLMCLHKEDIIHRDLHSKNILVNNGVLIIGDFGLSKQFSAEATSNSKVYGMPAYVEPQHYILKGEYVRDKKSDIYALGVLLWEITSGQPPFNNYDDAATIIAIFEGKRESPIENTPSEYQQLYEKCWNAEPNLRPDINEVYEILTQLKLQLNTNEQNVINKITKDSNIYISDSLKITSWIKALLYSATSSNHRTTTLNPIPRILTSQISTQPVPSSITNSHSVQPFSNTFRSTSVRPPLSVDRLAPPTWSNL